MQRYVAGFQITRFTRSAGRPAGRLATRRSLPTPPHGHVRPFACLTGALVASVALAGCHGIQPSAPSPLSTPAARSTVPVRLNLNMSPGELPIGGGSAVVRVEALGADGFGVSTSVNLAVDGGELAGSQVQTDSTGHAVTSWQGTKTVTITGTAGDVSSSATLKVNEPIVFPPSPPPPPSPPAPAPSPIPPAPPTVPQPTVSLSAYPDRVAVGYITYLYATTANLSAGETVVAYQWSWDGGTTIDETSISDTRPHSYSTDGIKAPKVTIITSGGKTATGTGKVIVYRP